MCRIAGYFGPPAPLASLLVTPSHGLRAQAKEPRELPPGIIGSDGHGVGWFVDHCRQPARTRSILPIWADENVDTMSMHITSSSIVASTRTATRQMPVAITNTPPFQPRDGLLVHNGSIDDFHEKVADRLRDAIAPATRQRILGNTDTEYLTALLHDREEGPLEHRVRKALGTAAEHIERAGTTAQLNLIVAERDALVIVRLALGKDAPSLYVHVTDESVTAASEPLDDGGGWESVAPGEIITVRGAARGCTVDRARV
ncbi:MAG: Glutamine amidotransferase class-II [Labilithrix sp.]|nr:Glutamine amidotransferase class-II [Labilithrix sp.]